MKVIIDTNFILSCVRQGIHFIEKIEEDYGEIVIPLQVIHELEKLSKDKQQKLRDRESASVSLQLIKKYGFKTIDLKNDNTDEGIIEYAKDKEVVVATLDREVKSKLNDKIILTIREKKRVDMA